MLLLREGANLTYLETDAQRSQEALTLALSITSALGNPELAEPVKQCHSGAWAYAESVSDVRILLDGGHVPWSRRRYSGVPVWSISVIV